jgi:DNA-binding beta-propeller fold protein YncE
LGEDFIIGGDFSSAGGVASHRVASINSDSGEPNGWTSHLDTYYLPRAVAVTEDHIFVSGEFYSIPGNNAVVVLDRETGVDVGWLPVSDSLVPDLLVSDGLVFVASDPMQVYDASTLEPVGFPAIDGYWKQLAASEEILLVSTTHPARIQAINLASREVMPWVLEPNGPIYDLTIVDRVGYVAGLFDSLNGEARQGLAAFDVLSGELIPWSPTTNGYVYSVCASANSILIGGEFSMACDEPRSNIAAVDPLTGELLDWNPGANGQVYVIVADGGRVHIGGPFTTIDGQFHPNFATLGVATREPMVVHDGPIADRSSTVGSPRLELVPPRPNPLRTSTLVSFRSSPGVPVRLDLVDLAGRRVRALIEREPGNPGTRAISLERGNLAAGGD